MLETRLIEELRTVVGASHVLERPSSLLAFESDALPGYHKRPSVAVFPSSRDQVVSLVRLFAAHHTQYVPRGAGTGLSGGALADGVVLLGLNRLKQILSIDPAARTARVEPGVVNASLSTAAAKYGLHYAPDPSSQTACTIGGNVAENAGGPHCLKYGVTLNHVLSANIVLPSGETVALRLPATPQDGYDLLGAYVGSEGCFGVTLDVTVRLTPNPESVRTMLADYTTVDDAAHTVSAIVASGIVPAACELMDHGTIAAVEASIYAAGYPTDAAAVLLVEVDGAADGVADDAARVEAMCMAHGARSVRSASDPAERARLWQGRKKAFGAMGRIAPNLVVQDAVVPRTRLAEILRDIAAVGERHRVHVCNVFHAGDGNLHPNIPYNGRDPDETARVQAAMREIMTLCIDAGGTITGEHGVGLDKLQYMPQLFPHDTLDAMCRLRNAWDAERRANPGKVVPVHSCKEWHGVVNNQKNNAGQAGTMGGHTRSNPALSANVSGSFAVQDVVVGVEKHLVEQINAARENNRKLYIAGAGTQVAEAPPHATRINVNDNVGVIEYVPSDLTITVGAGMTLAALNDMVGEHNQWCPFLPWGNDAGTVGGCLATSRRGPASATLGSPRDLALGLTFIDGLGAAVSAGGRVVKNVAGFDLARLLVGSWGSLGIITSASLRLRARPPASETWIIASENVNGTALREFVRGPFTPVACEWLDARGAARIGSRPEPSLVVWLAGGTAHVHASRAALRALGPAQELPESVWCELRAHGPLDPPAESRPVAPSLANLNARVRDAFDPARVFASARKFAGND